MIIIRHDEQEMVSWRPGNVTRKHASRALGSTQLTAGEQWFKAGTGAPLHFHPEGTEEVIWVREGRLRFFFEDSEFVLEQDQTIILPPTSRHGFVALEDSHIGGGGLSNSVQSVVYLDEPDRVYDIGAAAGAGEILDSHRRVRIVGSHNG